MTSRAAGEDDWEAGREPTCCHSVCCCVNLVVCSLAVCSVHLHTCDAGKRLAQECLMLYMYSSRARDHDDCLRGYELSTLAGELDAECSAVR